MECPGCSGPSTKPASCLFFTRSRPNSGHSGTSHLGQTRHIGDVRAMSACPSTAGSIAASRQTTREVELRMGAVAWGLWPTLRFPSPLIKPGVPIFGTRLSDWLHRKAHNGRSGQALQAQHVAFSVNDVEGEPSCAAPLHPMPPSEEVAHVLVDIMIDAPECRPTCPMGEVTRPAAQ